MTLKGIGGYSKFRVISASENDQKIIDNVDERYPGDKDKPWTVMPTMWADPENHNDIIVKRNRVTISLHIATIVEPV